MSKFHKLKSRDNARQERLKRRLSSKCPLCGRPLNDEPVNVDHIRPLGAGGSNRPRNKQLAHERCNSIKGRKWDGEIGYPKENANVQ